MPDEKDVQDFIELLEGPTEASPTETAEPPEGEPRRPGETAPVTEPKIEGGGVTPPSPPPPPQVVKEKPVVAKPPAPLTPPPPPPAAPGSRPSAKLERKEFDPARLKALREEHLTAVRQRYAFTKEQTEQFITEPEKLIPDLLAQAHMNAFDASIHALAQLLPTMIVEITGQQQREAETEGHFFREWPQLKGHGEKVLEVARVYRGVNPGASEGDAIKAVGAQTCYLLGLPVELSAPPSPVAPARSKPPVPVGVGAAGGPADKGSDNIWAELFNSAQGV